MKQPVLGKKVSELRLAKGMTQSELAEKCNISLRTIQRIESADVMPRSHTVKLIFSHLGFEIYDSPENQNQDAVSLKEWLADLFNLKTNTMKKVTILSIPCLSLWLLFLGFNAKAQTAR
ncbi:MAG: helix-turn-helix domain-containing protein [Flavobacterium sp.]|uniref:helix-turn-helix domain-containing protein n=1 Tax=Flavobacterium sp. TaxID=239 RepID=UPI00120B3E03|nr:helix-turn-helix domain-containing protein [Flavobacterium sp.]RZJ66161.1 MAG: helix-turn-helix domain-containing protein [Flavobacterium sp.]